MRHRKFSQRLSRPQGARCATSRNLLIALLRHQRIKTTKAKAKFAQRFAERLISLGRKNNLHSRRQAMKILNDRDIVGKLFSKIAPLFKDKPSGFTRVIHCSHRSGDGAEMVLLELTQKLPEEKPKEVKKKKKEKAPLEEPGKEKGPKPEVKPKEKISPPKKKEKPAKKIKPKKFLSGLKRLFKKERDSL